MKTLLLIAIFSLTDVCFAAAGDIDDFFVSFLKGEQTVFESNKRREIQRMRVEIWTAWREAVNENEEFKLAKMDKDTVVSAGKWKLPPELENNAVMNFTLFNKGKKPLTGYPLFLYLHGSGPKEKEYARGLELTKGFNDAPSVYFVPQIPNEGGYYRWWQRAKIYAWERLLRLAMVSGDYNPDKIYIVGISEGAYGTQRLTSYFADYLAGGGAMAGGELRQYGFLAHNGVIRRRILPQHAHRVHGRGFRRTGTGKRQHVHAPHRTDSRERAQHRLLYHYAVAFTVHPRPVSEIRKLGKFPGRRLLPQGIP